VGNGTICASFSGPGRWLSIGTPHPVHGFVEIIGGPGFDEECRGNAEAVRDYRARLAKSESAFLSIDPIDGILAAEACVAPDGAVMDWRLMLAADTEYTIRFEGRLQRHPYAEITDIAPLEEVASGNLLACRGLSLTVRDSALSASTEVSVHLQRLGADEIEYRPWSSGPDGTNAAGMAIAAPPGGCQVTIRCVLVVPPDEKAVESAVVSHPAGDSAARCATLGGSRLPRLAGSISGHPAFSEIASRTAAYILDCTAMRVSADERCIITDHRLLPLSWTRDAYFQAALLLCRSDSDPRGVARVADHLRWLWRSALPQAGLWMRSHLTGGQVKDPGVQADQQLYPLLELCDYRRVVGQWPVRADGDPDWPTWARQTWGRLSPDPATGLLGSTETPADDPASLPFALSNQILYWYVAVRLAEWAPELGLSEQALRLVARRVRAAVDDVFAVDGPFGRQWSYEADDAGHHRRYQDANDLPTALAPMWGFCDPANGTWVATMRFAFDPRNPGYQTGPFGGLGSAHTPGTWPLGDIQEWVAGRCGVDPDRGRCAARRLAQVAADDGMLPEAYSPEDGRWLARDWFAWPGAALGVADATVNGLPSPWNCADRRGPIGDGTILIY
jgi:hypothetical protein